MDYRGLNNETSLLGPSYFQHFANKPCLLRIPQRLCRLQRRHGVSKRNRETSDSSTVTRSPLFILPFWPLQSTSSIRKGWKLKFTFKSRSVPTKNLLYQSVFSSTDVDERRERTLLSHLVDNLVSSSDRKVQSHNSG